MTHFSSSKVAIKRKKRPGVLDSDRLEDHLRWRARTKKDNVWLRTIRLGSPAREEKRREITTHIALSRGRMGSIGNAQRG